MIVLLMAMSFCWDATSGTDTYWLYKAISHCGPWVATVETDSTCVSVDDPDPPLGHTYYYLVTAKNDHGESIKEHPELCVVPFGNATSSLRWQRSYEDGVAGEPVCENEVARRRVGRLRRADYMDALGPDDLFVDDSRFGFLPAGLWMSAWRGPRATDVTLRWFNGAPTFSVYRSDVAADLYDPENLLVQTADHDWVDTLPTGELWFYGVLEP